MQRRLPQFEIRAGELEQRTRAEKHLEKEDFLSDNRSHSLALV